MKAIGLSILLTLALAATTEGCHGTPPMPVPDDYADDAEYESALVRRKRSDIAPTDTRKNLTDFFTDCLKRKGRSSDIKSMRSVVDWVIRESLWYEILDKSLCRGSKDTRECWNAEADGLIDWKSKMLGQFRECILEYAEKSPVGGFRKKRDTNVRSEHDRFKRYKPDRPCPDVTDEIYWTCIEEEENITDAYYSLLESYHWGSIGTFLMEYYSKCRYELVWRSEEYVYQKVCPQYTRHRRAAINSKQQCLPLLFIDILREGSPIFEAAEICNERYLNVSMIINEEEEDDIAEKITAWDQEVADFGPLGKHKGSDIVGYCNSQADFTSWFDTTDKTGDSELLGKLRSVTDEFICSRPTGIQMRVSSNEKPWYTAGNNLKIMSPEEGLLCLNSMQYNKICKNFKVRFCCSQYESQNREASDAPSYPKTRSTVGTCGPRDEWGYWKNIDSPTTNGGDFELFERYGMPKCDPVAVQGRIRESNIPYTQAHNNLRTEDPKVGIVCEDVMQPREKLCQDFEVRFCCKEGRGIVATTPPAQPTTNSVTKFQIFKTIIKIFT